MSELIVVGFQGKRRAAEVLAQVQELDAQWKLDLDDAVAVYRTDDGRLRLDQSVRPTTKEGAGWGGLLGVMLGSLLAAPFTLGASTAVAAAAIGTGAVTLGATGAIVGAEDAAVTKEDFGIGDDFVKQVGGMVQPGQSAIFVLGRVRDPERIIEQFRGYGGTILHTTLPPAAAARLQQVIAGEPAARA